MTSIFIGQNTLKTPIRRSNLLPNPESISLRNLWKNWPNTAAHPDCSVVEMDVVEGAGSKSSPILLTLFFRSCSSMFLFFLESDCRASIRDVFDFLYAALVPARYSRLFPWSWLIANSHFPRPAGPHFPASQGHIKRSALEIGRARGAPPC